MRDVEVPMRREAYEGRSRRRHEGRIASGSASYTGCDYKDAPHVPLMMPHIHEARDRHNRGRDIRPHGGVTWLPRIDAPYVVQDLPLRHVVGNELRDRRDREARHLCAVPQLRARQMRELPRMVPLGHESPEELGCSRRWTRGNFAAVPELPRYNPRDVWMVPPLIEVHREELPTRWCGCTWDFAPIPQLPG